MRERTRFGLAGLGLAACLVLPTGVQAALAEPQPVITALVRPTEVWERPTGVSLAREQQLLAEASQSLTLRREAEAIASAQAQAQAQVQAAAAAIVPAEPVNPPTPQSTSEVEVATDTPAPAPVARADEGEPAEPTPSPSVEETAAPSPAPPPPPPPPPPPTGPAVNTGSILVLVKKHFPADQVTNAMAVSHCETWHTNAISRANQNGSRDWGVFQLNDSGTLQTALRAIGIGFANTQQAQQLAMDPEINVRAARWLWSVRGWGPWVCAYKTGIVDSLYGKLPGPMSGKYNEAGQPTVPWTRPK